MLTSIIVAVVSALAGFVAAWAWKNKLRKKAGQALADAAAKVKEG